MSCDCVSALVAQQQKCDDTRVGHVMQLRYHVKLLCKTCRTSSLHFEISSTMRGLGALLLQTRPEKKHLAQFGLDLIKGEVRINVQAGVLEPTLAKTKIIQVCRRVV